ncbi:MAG TPA: DUF6051 family protein [Tenuifilaceae bacterium]|nr:DUF6051 family protein [Tenuifilaceae bacterium]
MNYTEEYNKLKNAFTSLYYSELDNIEVHELDFESQSYSILPGTTDYCCTLHNLNFKNEFTFYTEVGSIKDNVYIKDIYVEENKLFKYHLIKQKGQGKAKKVTLLFHGFNEKQWDKYLPWATTICKETGSAVILFPIAFHMQRAPLYWSSKREMFNLSRERTKRYPNVVSSTLSNVAISMRIHSMPQRFIWSGLQTYYDVIQLIEDCKAGNNAYIDKNFEFNIFAYSIGGFLAQILKLTNHKNYFDNTKVCLFCGGSTFNLFSPVSKFIMDGEANASLYSFLVEHFDEFLQQDKRLHHYIEENHPEGKVFHSMLDYHKMQEFREDLLKKYETQIYAISLKQDHVIPSYEVATTLKGVHRDINIDVEELDFDFPYSHENPFPISSKDAKEIDKSFDFVFGKVCNFFNK